MLKCCSSMRAICCMARSSAIDVKVPPISKFVVQIICRTHSHHGDNCTAKMANEFLPGGLLNSLHNLTQSALHTQKICYPHSCCSESPDNILHHSMSTSFLLVQTSSLVATYVHIHCKYPYTYTNTNTQKETLLHIPYTYSNVCILLLHICMHT